MTQRKFGVIYNPTRDSAIQVREFINYVRDFAEVVDLPTTAEPGSATKLAAQAAALGLDGLVACGGDGMFCQVCEGVAGTKVPVFNYAAGTACLFHRAFTARLDSVGAADLLERGTAQAIDMIELTYTDVEGKPQRFLFMVGMGLGELSDAISDASPAMKARLGKFAYVIRTVAAAFRLTGIQFTFVYPDGRQVVAPDAVSMFALNVTPPTMATLSRGCNASDGLVDITWFTGTRLWRVVTAALSLAFGRPENSGQYEKLRASEITICTDKPLRPNIDGDPTPAGTEFHLRVLPKAVNVVLSV